MGILSSTSTGIHKPVNLQDFFERGWRFDTDRNSLKCLYGESIVHSKRTVNYEIPIILSNRLQPFYLVFSKVSFGIRNNYVITCMYNRQSDIEYGKDEIIIHNNPGSFLTGTHIEIKSIKDLMDFENLISKDDEFSKYKEEYYKIHKSQCEIDDPFVN